MVVVTRNKQGWDGLGGQFPRSRTNMYPDNAARVSRARQSAGDWISVNRMNGLGAITDTVPAWALWGAGGLALGVVAGLAAKRFL